MNFPHFQANSGPPAKSGDPWEFPRHHIKIFSILGEGCFGQVWKCEAINIDGKNIMLFHQISMENIAKSVDIVIPINKIAQKIILNRFWKELRKTSRNWWITHFLRSFAGFP